MKVRFTYSIMGEHINGFVYRDEFSFIETYEDTEFNKTYFKNQAAHDQIMLNPYSEDYGGSLFSIRSVRIVG